MAANSQEIAFLLAQPGYWVEETNFPQLPLSAVTISFQTFTQFLGFRTLFSIPHFKCHQFEYFLRLSASQASDGDFTNLGFSGSNLSNQPLRFPPPTPTFSLPPPAESPLFKAARQIGFQILTSRISRFLSNRCWCREIALLPLAS